MERARSIAPSGLILQDTSLRQSKTPLPSPSDPMAAFEGVATDGKIVWQAFLSSEVAPNIVGYAGPIELLIGVDGTGTITGVALLHHVETPTFVAGIEESWFLGQFIGKTLTSPLTIGEEIDGIAQATVTVNAIRDCVRSVLERAAQSTVFASKVSMNATETSPANLFQPFSQPSPPWTFPLLAPWLALFFALFLRLTAKSPSGCDLTYAVQSPPRPTEESEHLPNPGSEETPPSFSHSPRSPSSLLFHSPRNALRDKLLPALLIGFAAGQFLSFSHLQTFLRNPSAILHHPALWLVFASAALLLTIRSPRGYCAGLCPMGLLQESLNDATMPKAVSLPILSPSQAFPPSESQKDQEHSLLPQIPESLERLKNIDSQESSAGFGSPESPQSLARENTDRLPRGIGRTLFWTGLLATIFTTGFPGERLEVFSALFVRNQGLFGWLLVIAALWGALLHRRFYCRVLCPLNAVFSDLEIFFGRLRRALFSK